MAYRSTNIIARRGYSGFGCGPSAVGGVWDTLKDVGKGALDFYGQTQQQAGAAAAQAAQNTALTQALTQRSPAPLGLSTTTLALIGVGGLALFLALRK